MLTLAAVPAASRVLRRGFFTYLQRCAAADFDLEARKRRAAEKINLVKKRNSPSPEDLLLEKLRKTQMKLEVQQERLKHYTLPDEDDGEHDPEIITPEQLQALKKRGYKNKNYLPVGVRGIYGGTIENLHQHWKFHETCQVDLHMFPKFKYKEMGTELARLSGGIVIDIIGPRVIMYRGKNYKQPDNLIPDNLLNKRQALYRARFSQSKRMIEQNIERLKFRMEKLRQQSDIAKAVDRLGLSIPTEQLNYRVDEAKRGDDMLYLVDSSDDEITTGSSSNTSSPEVQEDERR